MRAQYFVRHHQITLQITLQRAKIDNNSCCLQCITPSKDKSVIDNLNLSFSHPRIEKSDSTEAVLANTVAIPPQKSLKISKRPSTMPHASSNDAILMCSYPSKADLSAGSVRYATTSCRCSFSISSMVCTFQKWRNCMRCGSTIVFPKSRVDSLMI